MGDGWEPVMVGGQSVLPGGDGPPVPTRKDPETPWPWDGPWRHQVYDAWFADLVSWRRPRTPQTTRRQKSAAERSSETCGRCGHGRATHTSGTGACNVGHPSRFARRFAPHNPYGCQCHHWRLPDRRPEEPHRRWQTWTPADYRAVLDARARGVTFKSLGETYGCTAGRMGQVVWKAERLRAAGKLRQLRLVPPARVAAVPRLSSRADLC